MAAEQGFRVEEVPDNVVPLQNKVQNAATAALILGLKALSQRALIALADLFCLMTVISAFLLWSWIPNPSVNQLIALGMYACFLVAVNVIVRRK